ncbi:putative WhiB family transcriptional regulator [Kitasatospora setae KM-6054]|uniref:Transcriptional regulator WhiB n=1 Tax=Kitasatospora setae (strain ATCC 33774 / DSM 43861 / JCM 3304 / KCC A-0304 / NBRC 14216 / KM-6054) TaxID=452652 RepID=E4NJQ6_KITSK|nr:putative WhiB family transcriptional regulator [Kitasatospora setae KM-6054]
MAADRSTAKPTPSSDLPGRTGPSAPATPPPPAAAAADRGADWRGRAACTREDPELFFPVGNSGAALRQTERAKAVCRGCPVTRQCLRWALENKQDTGVWGATGEEERRAMIRRAARQRTRHTN